MQAGKFITFEGTEGVGKTTAINHLCQHLEEKNIAFIRTREPGGSPFAEALRTLLLSPNTRIEDDTELLMMFAARSDHLYKVIMPALAAGKWVICDRFTDSSVAYQGYGRGQGDTLMLQKIESLISNFVPRMPDITLWLDLPVKLGMERAGKRSAADRFEQEALDFFERVYRGFKAQYNAHSDRIYRINASGTEQDVSARICHIIDTLAQSRAPNKSASE